MAFAEGDGRPAGVVSSPVASCRAYRGATLIGTRRIVPAWCGRRGASAGSWRPWAAGAVAGAGAARCRHRGWLSAWKTSAIQTPRPSITTIGMTMAARFDPVKTIISSERAGRLGWRGKGRCFWF